MLSQLLIIPKKIYFDSFLAQTTTSDDGLAEPPTGIQ